MKYSWKCYFVGIYIVHILFLLPPIYNLPWIQNTDKKIFVIKKEIFSFDYRKRSFVIFLISTVKIKTNFLFFNLFFLLCHEVYFLPLEMYVLFNLYIPASSFFRNFSFFFSYFKIPKIVLLFVQQQLEAKLQPNIQTGYNRKWQFKERWTIYFNTTLACGCHVSPIYLKSLHFLFHIFIIIYF